MVKPFRGRLVRTVVFVLLGWIGMAGAGTLPPSVLVAPPQPKWHELTSEQKQVLSPLAKEWDDMEHYRRKKWLGIVKTYGKLNAGEQQRVQERMQEWVRLTPEQRRSVRQQYQEFNRLSADQKEQLKRQWQLYANLSEEEKSRLKAKAINGKALSGTATPPANALSPTSGNTPNGTPASAAPVVVPTTPK